jgi:hypothetical protein
LAPGNFADMYSNRHDSLTNRPYWRLWIEGNDYDRLGRNGFTPGGRFNICRKPGFGVVIDESATGNYKVTPRRNSAVLSYEARDLGDFFGTPDIRVRIHVNKIVVNPLLRFHTVARPKTEVWQIRGAQLTTVTNVHELRTLAPLNLPQCAARIEAELDETNLVFATELIGNQRPGTVKIHGSSVLMIVAGQFLRAGGYSETGVPGEFAR